MKVLLCTIIRNREKYLDRWYNQIVRIKNSMPHIEFGISVFENDSEDNSKKLLSSYDFSMFNDATISMAKYNMPYFIGGKIPNRVALLAYFRNRCISQTPFLNSYDYICFIEPDVEFSEETARKIIDHEKYYGRKFDIFSGKSVHPGTDRIYDSWGSRVNINRTDWVDAEDEQIKGLHEMHSTFNCFVMYNNKYFLNHQPWFSGSNPRTNWPDCDTVNICEAFRIAGMDQIFFDASLLVAHNV